MLVNKPFIQVAYLVSGNSMNNGARIDGMLKAEIATT